MEVNNYEDRINLQDPSLVIFWEVSNSVRKRENNKHEGIGKDLKIVDYFYP